MSIRSFHTTGKQDIIETVGTLRSPNRNEIQVETRLVGVCRSDVDMFNGDFELAAHIQGHEGLGVVVSVGDDVPDINLGDVVATNADNCFADRYNAPMGMFIKVPEVSPKYILEPVACAINIVFQLRAILDAYNLNPNRICVVGSGFLSQIICSVLADFSCVCVVGRANNVFFNSRQISQVENVSEVDGMFDVIIDLKDDAQVMIDIQHNINPKGIYVIGAQKHNKIMVDYSDQLWKALTYIFPSPRGPIPFVESMKQALVFVDNNPWVADIWTHEYNRNDGLIDAFTDPSNRQHFEKYGRGYIKYTKG